MNEIASSRYAPTRLTWTEVTPSGDFALWDLILPIVVWISSNSSRVRRYVRMWGYASHRPVSRHAKQAGPRHLRRTPFTQRIGWVQTPEVWRIYAQAKAEAAE